jgi:hypothetical protein
MKKNLFLLRLSLTIFSMTIADNVISQTLLVENFIYSSGSALTANGWTAHSGAGNNPVLVSSSGLVFSGYPSSNTGLAAFLNNDGEDVNKTFTQVTKGDVYCAFLFKAGSVTNDYFFHLSNSGIVSNRARVYMKGTGNSFSFGLSKGSEAATYTSGSAYSTGTTYLLILKYTIVEGSFNDNVSLYILTGSIPSTEPVSPSVGPLIDGGQSDLSNVSAVALRQYSTSQNIVVDGIRVAQKWDDVVGITTYNNQITTKNILFIYPNPVRNNLTIRNSSYAGVIEIKDLSGRVKYSIRGDSEDEVNMDVSSLTGGIYFVTVTSSSGSKTMKLIKE